MPCFPIFKWQLSLLPPKRLVSRENSHLSVSFNVWRVTVGVVLNLWIANLIQDWSCYFVFLFWRASVFGSDQPGRIDRLAWLTKLMSTTSYPTLFEFSTRIWQWSRHSIDQVGREMTQSRLQLELQREKKSKGKGVQQLKSEKVTWPRRRNLIKGFHHLTSNW